MSDLFDAVEFRAGLRVGLAALAIGAVLGLVWRQWRGRRLPAGGLLVAAAGVVAVRANDEVPDALLLGLASLAAAGLAGDLLRVPLSVRAVLAVPGAVLVGLHTDLPGESWVEPAALVVCVLGGVAVSDFDRRWRRPTVAPALLALTFAGAYATVPDTEHVRAVLAPALLVSALGWPVNLVRVGSGGAFAAVGLLTWAAAVDGIGRPGSVVGALAGVGILAAEPVSRVVARFRGPLVPNPSAVAVVALGIAQLLVVGVTSRVAGFRHEASAAAAIAVPVLLGATVVCAAAARLLRRSGRATA